MQDSRQARLALVAWIGSLVGAIALFTWLGGGRLGVPSVTEPAAWGAWVSDREPAEALFALGRLLVLALAWYLVGVTTLGVVARWARSLRLVRVADALAVPSVRRLLQASLGLGLATAAVASSTAQVARPFTPPLASGSGVIAAAADATTEVVEVPADPEEPRDHIVDVDAADPLWHLVLDPAGGEAGPPSDAVPTPDAAAVADVGADPAAPEVRAASLGAAAEDRVWVTEAGDHFWNIAERVVTQSLGRDAADDEVDPYWRLLVEANRGELVHAGDPDLIYPGQRFVLPAVPA